MRLRDLLELPRLGRLVVEPLSYLRARRGSRAGEVYTLRFRDGQKLELRGGSRDFHVFHRIFVRDEYRIDCLDLTPDSTVVDVGAHCGIFALRVAAAGCRVVCVEPAPENLERLRRTIRDNQLEDRVTVSPRALAGSGGEYKIVRGIDPYAHVVLEAGAPDPGEPVESVTLAELFEETAVESCDLLKLDCEGSEYRILLETPPEALRRIERMRVEYHPGSRPEETPENLRAQLTRSGFRVELRAKRRARGQGHLFAERAR